jgi:hypothetical protein
MSRELRALIGVALLTVALVALTVIVELLRPGPLYD